MRFVKIGGVVATLVLALTPSVAARPSRPADEDLTLRPSAHSAALARSVFTANPLHWDGISAQADRNRSAGSRRATGPVMRRSDGLFGLNETFTWVIDDFDDTVILNPLLWLLNQDLNDLGGVTNDGNYLWSLTRCKSKSPPQSMWPFGGGVDGANMTCDRDYPNGVSASVIMGLETKSLFSQPPGSLRLLMDVMFNLRDFQENGVEADGLFVNLVIPPSDGNPQPKRVTLLHRTGRYPEAFFKDPLEIDFLDAQNVYVPEERFNLLEMDTIFIEFLAITQRPTEANTKPSTFQGGMFVDNIRFESDTLPTLPEGTAIATVAVTVAATYTPEVGETPPTATMTPVDDTPTPTATSTGGTEATPTRTPTTPRPTTQVPSQTPVGKDIFLPWVSKGQ